MRCGESKNGFFFRHRYFMLIFTYLTVYHVIVVNRLGSWKLNDLTYGVYCVDFGFGFASKLLPGAVYNLLFGAHASRASANAYAVAVILLVFAGIALLLEKFLLGMPQERRRTAAVMLLFFLSGAYSFSIFTKWVGMADTYWLPITLLFFVFTEHKYLRWLTPAVYILALMIHFSALVFYIPTFSIILLYRMAITRKKQEQWAFGMVFAASMVLTAVFFFFLLLNEANMVCPIEEFHEKLREHGTDYFFYYDYSFFRIWGGESFIPDSVREMAPSLTKFFYLFYYQVKLINGLFAANRVNGLVSIIGGILLLAPAVLFVFRFHLHRLRAKGNGLLRFCSFLMLVQFPFIHILGLLFAAGIDMTRYYTYAFLGLAICLLTVLYHEAAAREEFLIKLEAAENTLPFKIYFLAYAAMAIMPC